MKRGQFVLKKGSLPPFLRGVGGIDREQSSRDAFVCTQELAKGGTRVELRQPETGGIQNSAKVYLSESGGRIDRQKEYV
jgi:hypothetical protein